MVIESVEVRSYGRLSGFKTDFHHGFNLIEGPNESGKSTLASFLLYMLYGFEDGKTPADAMPERDLRTPWGDGEISGSMTLSNGGRRYRVDRESTLSEDGKSDRFTVTDLESGESESRGPSPGERFLGVPRDVYIGTAFFGAPYGYHVDGDGMNRAIENIVFSGDERLSLAHALVALKEARTQLISTAGKNGAVLSLEKQRDALRERLLAARERERELTEKENQLYLTREKRKECERELAKFHRLETDYHNAMMIRDYDALHALEDSLAEKDAALAAYESDHRSGVFLPSVAYVTELTTAKAQFERSEETLARAREAAEAAQSEENAVSAEEEALICHIRTGGDEQTLRARVASTTKRVKGETVAFSVLFSLAILFGILFAVNLALSHTRISLAMAALALLSVGAGIVLFLEYRRTSGVLLSLYDLGYATSYKGLEESLALAADAESRKEMQRERRAAAILSLQNAENDRSAKARVLEGVLHRMMPDAVLDGTYRATVTELVAEVEEYVQRHDALLKEREAIEAEVRALRSRLSGQNEIAVRALVPPDRRAALCNHNASDLRHGVEHYEKMLQSFSEKVEALENELATVSDGESSADVAEEMQLLETRIRSMREDASLYGAAEKRLEGSFARMREEIAPRLSLYACGLLCELTGGKYSELRIGDDLSLSVVIDGEERPVSYLSGGTKEMMYLALRMALLDLLYESNPPVCLDETLAHQDDGRVATFMSALETVAAGGTQCLLFTCHTRERRLADEIFASYKRIEMY